MIKIIRVYPWLRENVKRERASILASFLQHGLKLATENIRQLIWIVMSISISLSQKISLWCCGIYCGCYICDFMKKTNKNNDSSPIHQLQKGKGQHQINQSSLTLFLSYQVKSL